MGLKRVEKRQVQLNKELASILKRNGIDSLKLTSVGNSIASGYSMVRTIKPLLLRNDSLVSIMEKNNVVLVRKHFARAQNNNDEHIAGWFFSNIKESEIHKMNRIDYGDGPTKMPGVMHGLNDGLVDSYYPLDVFNDQGLSDVVLEDAPNLANIVIYNGCTGSFLDNVTRDGKFMQKFTYGFKRDITGLISVLNYIQTSNRCNNTNTQVYICGAPDFLGLGISNYINNKLKKIADNYANATYVKPIKSKLFYKSIDPYAPLLLPDVHYDEIEYLKFNNNIISAINSNYMINRSMINMDRHLFNLSRSLEFDSSFFGDDFYIRGNVLDCYHKESSKFSENQRTIFNEKTKKYLKQRAPYDFYYVGKKNIDSIM